jgi:UDP-2,3-diacylglucosamine pyrophosphatase LpxH
MHPRVVRRPGGADEANVLAISDLHLGHDLRRGVVAREKALDRQLVSLLDGYCAEGGRWRLVIVGDMVDFIAITQTPDVGEAVPFTVTDAERCWGLGPEPEKSVWKLGRVFERHASFFIRLARFLAAGHELVIVRGNHDPEWAQVAVQQSFRDRLALLARAHLPRATDTLGERIRFCDWFYLEPGRLYAEHGHHYDEYSVTPGAALDGTPDASAGEPLSTVAMRYFANLHTTLDLSEVERWKFWDFVRWGARERVLLRAARDYLGMCAKVLGLSVRASLRTLRRSGRRLVRAGRELAREDHKLGRTRAALAVFRQDREELARQLITLVRAPAEQSLFASIQLLYVDRLALVAVVALAWSACLALAAGPLQQAGALAVVLAAASVVNGVLDRARLVDSHPKLLDAARSIGHLLRVPIVVMGHSHRTVWERVGEHTTYVNLGTWLAPSRSECGGRPGFPHLVVRDHNAELRRWKPRRSTLPEAVA